MGAEFGKRGMSRLTAIAAREQTQQSAGDAEAGTPPSTGLPMLFAGLGILALVAVLYFANVFDLSPKPVIGADGKPIELIPSNELLTPKDDMAKSLALIDKYPRDPRAHLFRGIYFLERKSLADAERELRAALAEPQILNTLDKDIEKLVRMTLAIVLANRGRRPEAITIARPICGTNLRRVAPEFLTMFERARVCPRT